MPIPFNIEKLTGINDSMVVDAGTIDKVLPEFLFDVEGVQIVKKMAMVYGENKIAIKYNIVNTLDEEVSFKLVPFVNFRSYHIVQDAREYEQSYEN